MKRLAFGLLIMFISINIVNAEPSAFFKEFNIVNGIMNTQFNKNNDMYTVYVDSGEYCLNFDYLLEDEDASIIIANNELVNDSTEVIVTVVSSDDSIKKDYYFTVYKYSEEEVFHYDNNAIKLDINKKSNFYIESVISIIAFYIILFFFYKLFLT